HILVGWPIAGFALLTESGMADRSADAGTADRWGCPSDRLCASHADVGPQYHLGPLSSEAVGSIWWLDDSQHHTEPNISVRGPICNRCAGFGWHGCLLHRAF